jgi:c-di-GMP-specific phosphodiesterase
MTASAALISEIEQGLQNGAFEPVFQPIARLSDGALAGFEALARWRRGPGPLTEPSVFIEAALEKDLLGAISRSILHAATRTAAGWRTEGAPALFVTCNVAGRDLEREDFCLDVLTALSRAALPAGALKIEVTEQQVLRDPFLVSRNLEELREAGAQVVFDDFGTGFSSLSWLTRLPVDGIKFDQTMIAGIAADGAERKIVRAMIALAHDMGLYTVGEGVETEDQREILAELACDYAQGALYAMPLPEDAVRALIAALPRE